ncbi:MAG: ABC transporter ATP-binding protein [Thermodesulfobacteriota bacterium]
MTRAFLQVESLTLSVGNFSLRNIQLSCGKGEYHVLLGPTGSGKSTLIKCMLGLFRIYRGAVFLNGRDISRCRPEDRRMGYVPQHYSLFPHLTVEENIRFGLFSRKQDPGTANVIVDRLCDTFHIGHLRGRGIRHLSGGEKQKVALARALAIQPDLVFLDEPFSSIDEGSRRDLWVELKKIINEIGMTAFHITHNLEEAYSLGERLSVILNGEIHQSGAKNEIFERPATREVAAYLNYRNIFSGTARAHTAGTVVDTDAFRFVLSGKIPDGEKVALCIRQQDVKIIKEGRPLRDQLKDNVIAGVIVSIFSFPEYCLIYFKSNSSSQAYDFEIKLPPYLRERHDLFPGKTVRIAFWEPNIIVFPRENPVGLG